MRDCRGDALASDGSRPVRPGPMTVACPYCGGDESRCDYDWPTDHCRQMPLRRSPVLAIPRKSRRSLSAPATTLAARMANARPLGRSW
jgi:hypothetical protein